MSTNQKTLVDSNGHRPGGVPLSPDRETELLRQIVDLAAQLDTAKRSHDAENIQREKAEDSVHQIADKLAAAQQEILGHATHLQTAREEERAYLARELHDQLGQLLSAVKMYVSALARNLTSGEQPPAVGNDLKAISSGIDEALKLMRELLLRLKPEILTDVGLLESIRWQLSAFQTRTGIQCLLKTKSEQCDLDDEHALVVFRIVQEALNNVARHSGATQVEVNFGWQADECSLNIHDNGRGFEPQDAAKSQAFGLRGMRERVQLLGGTFDIRGTSALGTDVNVRFPL